MNIDQFLAFWSGHNIVIIEGLIAAILLVAVALSYSLLFGKKDAADLSASAVNTEQIEKTLQKILDAQANAPAKDANLVSTTSSDPAAAAVGEELAQLRQALTEKETQIEQLKTQVASIGGIVVAPAADGAAATASSAPGMSAEDKLALENKIKDLEARLSEYEIISEDIADLSRYKEENLRLQRELDALRSGAGAPAPAAAAAPTQAAAPTPAPEPEPAPVVAAAAAPEPAPAAEPAISEADVAALAAEMAPQAGAEAPAEPSAEASSVIDDDLMKEFAAAVEGQKASTAGNETDKLMNDFENFIKKG